MVFSYKPRGNLVKGAMPRFRFPQGSQCCIYNLPVLNLLKPDERLFLQLQQLLPNLMHHHLPPGCKDFSDYYLSKCDPQ